MEEQAGSRSCMAQAKVKAPLRLSGWSSRVLVPLFGFRLQSFHVFSALFAGLVTFR
ncbi:hypothetical protein TSUD_152240 [Trifolium subterraneum]|uniref:Uncharacterized protein n=1 Tax=Trifolium subterraneum TaxID=3900 RepID=A0A2Z6NN37_TRISU|nr:hypothetical protein TSUD_152240 [Trifolium subterraneum]